MKLFEIDENNEVKINAPWIKLIPEFRALFFKRVNKTRESYEADVEGRRRLAYVYFMLDFGSPIRDWLPEKKQSEAMSYTGLSKADVEMDAMQDALLKYEMLQYEQSRRLRTFRVQQDTLDKADAYFQTINFSAVDKQGKLLYTPNMFTTNLIGMNKAYDELDKMEKTIKEELSGDTGIRGKSELGDREMQLSNGKKGKANTGWDEDSENKEFKPDNAPTAWTTFGESIPKQQE